MAMAVYVNPVTRVTVRRDDEMMALFIDNFVPPESLPRCSTCETVSSWYENFPSQIGRSVVLDQALSALCHLYLGQRFGNQDWIQKSQNLYASASAKLVTRIQSVEEQISASMVMATYEVGLALFLLYPRPPSRLTAFPALRSIPGTVWLDDPCAMRHWSTGEARPAHGRESLGPQSLSARPPV
jgi:hypothetical protein